MVDGVREAFERGPPPVGQVGRIAEPEMARASQELVDFTFGPPHLIDGVIDDLDGMELVEGYSGGGQVAGDALDEGGAHVDAHLSRALGSPQCTVRSSTKIAIISASLPSVANTTRAWSISTNSVM
jgi:hypothetical protein